MPVKFFLKFRDSHHYDVMVHPADLQSKIPSERFPLQGLCRL